MAVGVLVWRVLMLDPSPPTGMRVTAPERLSHHDRQALDRLLSERGARP
jgi:hypothetical protein